MMQQMKMKLSKRDMLPKEVNTNETISPSSVPKLPQPLPNKRPRRDIKDIRKDCCILTIYFVLLLFLKIYFRVTYCCFYIIKNVQCEIKK